MTEQQAHAHLGASNSAIWLNCSQAGRLMRTANKGKTSKFAAEGTLAHGLAEFGLVFGMEQVRKQLGDIQTVAEHDFEITDEMLGHVQTFHDYVSQRRESAGEGAQFYLEERVSLNYIFDDVEPKPNEQLFGTADVILVSADGLELDVFDLKYGAGVPVDADTPQGLYYAAGARQMFAPKAKLIRVHIIQPRAPHPDGPCRSQIYTALDIHNFETRVRTAVNTIVSGKGGYASGKWCRFCPLAGQCPELYKTSIAVAKGEFGDAVTLNVGVPAPAPLGEPPSIDAKMLSEKEIAYVLNRKDIIKRWLDAVEQEAMLRLSNDVSVEGYKLVAKRSRRVWDEVDPQRVVDLVRHECGDITANSVYEMSLLSPAQFQKRVPKAIYDEVVYSGLIVDVSSGVTLAFENDKRPAVKQSEAAKREFEAFGDTTENMET